MSDSEMVAVSEAGLEKLLDDRDSAHEQLATAREQVQRLTEALKTLRKYGHYECEDSYYSCPKHESYCRDDGYRECRCWTDHDNAIIDAVLTQPKEPT